MSTPENPSAAEREEQARSDAVAFKPGFGRGGVPWFLLLFYLSFLVFFTWYTLEFQLPDFLEDGPWAQEEAPAEGGGPESK